MARFYGHFAAAYGTIWFALMMVALVSQSHINTGEIGMFGFPIAALLYAALRRGLEPDGAPEVQRLRERIARLEGRLEAQGG